jgi:hypothetical protein
LVGFSSEFKLRLAAGGHMLRACTLNRAEAGPPENARRLSAPACRTAQARPLNDVV